MSITPAHRRLRRPISAIAIGAAMVLLSGCNAWLQFGGDSSHRNVNASETELTAANVSSLHQVWQATLPATADSSPVVTPVQTANGWIDLVIVTTRTGTVTARNLATGAFVWSASFPAGSCKINNGSTTCYTTSSPVAIGSAVYSYGLDGKVHKLTALTGVEVIDSTWPVPITLKPFDEKGSSALSFATAANGRTYLYAAVSGYPGDGGDYQGHIVVVDVASGSKHIFNTLCSNQTVLFARAPAMPDCPEVTSGVWARSGVTYDPRTDRIYLVTGNATFSPAAHHWGDTVLALHPDGTGTNGNPIDTFTPSNYQFLQDADVDLGSTLPAIVPAPSGSTVAHLGVQGGKEQKLYLLDMDNLSGQGGIGHTGGELQLLNVPQGGLVFTAPAVWTNPADGKIWVFVATNSGISGLTVTLDASHRPQLTPQWTNAAGSTSPIVANGVLYAAGGSAIQAFNPTTGASLWTTATAGNAHWQSPIVVGGYVVYPDNAGHLTAYHR